MSTPYDWDESQLAGPSTVAFLGRMWGGDSGCSHGNAICSEDAPCPECTPDDESEI